MNQVIDNRVFAEPLIHDVIRINSDSEFAFQALSEGWQGNGTSENPYIIEDYDIDANQNGDAIYVGNTTVFFIIRNCNLYNASSPDWEYSGCGIGLYRVINGSIENNNCSKNLFGIRTRESGNIVIRNNSCYSNVHAGIRIRISNVHILENNTCNKNDYGIYVWDSMSIHVSNNTCISNQWYGIKLYHSDNNYVESNKCIDHVANGIELTQSSYNTLLNNNCSKTNFNGIFLQSGSQHNLIENNTCRDNQHGIRLNGFPPTSLTQNNVVKSNKLISNSAAAIYLYLAHNNEMFSNIMEDSGIFLEGDFDTFTTQNIPTNNTVTGKPVGYYTNIDMGNTSVPLSYGEVILGNVSWCKVENQNTSSGSFGVLMGYSSNIHIKNNIFYKGQSGIRVESSNVIIVENNTCHENREGIMIHSSANITVKHNWLFSNSYYGIWISESSSYNTIVNNSFYENDPFGMYISRGSYNNSVRNNSFIRNTGYGLKISGDSKNNTINNNSFIYNTDSGDDYNISHIQAADSSIYNFWNSSSGFGNYWRDWKEPDINMDGIVDDPYKIQWNDSYDYYPLTNSPLPVISTPPRNLTAITWEGWVNLSWDEPDDDGKDPITGYRISRGTSSGGETYLAFVNDTCSWYNDTSVIGGELYYYYVTAVNNIGESNPSNEVSEMPPKKPSAPLNLSPTPRNGYVNMSWEEPGNNGSLPINEYWIYRGTAAGSETFLDSVSAEVLYYNDSSVINESTYYYFITAVNDVGEGNSSNEVNATPEGNPPTIEITTPINGSFIDSNSVSVEWIGADAISGIYNYKIKLDNETWIDIGTLTSHTLGALSGEHTVFVMAVDQALNTNITSVNFTVDTYSPHVNFQSPSENIYLSSDSVEVTWNSYDYESGINYSEIRINGEVWVEVGKNTTHIFQSLPTGSHDVEIIVYDMAGNSDHDNITFYTDAVIPTAVILDPDNGSIINLTRLELRWTGGDDFSGLDHYEVQLDQNGWINRGLNTTYNFSLYSDGISTFHLKAVDNAGNEKITNITITVDTISPQILILHPKMNSNEMPDVTVSWIASDNTSGIEHFEIKIDSRSWINIGTATQYLLQILEEGEHTLLVKAVDNASNVAIQQVIFTVDGIKPKVTSYSPEGNRVSVSSDLKVYFSEEINRSSLVINIEGALGTSSWIDNTLIFSPSQEFMFNTTYHVFVNCSDLAGNPLESHHWSFKTTDFGKITGRVVDINGIPLSDAIVTKDNQEMTTTGADGYFAFNIYAGTFWFIISKRGYESSSLKVTLFPGETYEIDDIYLSKIEEDPERKGPQEGFSWLIFVVILILVVCVLLFLLFQIMKKKVNPPEEGEITSDEVNQENSNNVEKEITDIRENKL